MRIEAELITRIVEFYMPADTDHETKKNAERLLSVAFDVAFCDPAEVSDRDIKETLEAITTGYGCWVGEVQQAFHRGRDEFPDGTEFTLYASMHGALRMASLWLADMHRANNWTPRARPAAPAPGIA